jgi:DNA-binding MarR family transcriptional regulator
MMTSQVLRRLEARGLLTRAPDPADSRARHLHLTSAGLALVARALADVEAADDEYFAAVGDEREAFLEALVALGGRGPARSEGGHLVNQSRREEKR